MDQRKAFFFLGITILAWTIFWNTAIRIAATRHASKKGGDSPALSGLLVAV